MAKTSDDTHYNRKRHIYGRKKARPLGKERQAAMDELYPKLSIPEEGVKARNIAPDALFAENDCDVWMEIGFGRGDHLAGLIERHPERCYIGAEPFINGMSAFLKTIRKQNLPHERIKVWMDDALLLTDALPVNYLSGIYLLNPDPWPKKRHHKRRFINHKNLTRLARVLKSGAPLIMSTDVTDLAEWMVTKSITHPDFYWTAQSERDWKTPPVGWIETKYEKKGKDAGRTQRYLIFRKK